MHSIKKISIRILLIFVVLLIYEIVIEFLYRPCTETVIYVNKERAEIEGSIETLLCGTSTAQRGFDPEMIDKNMETVSFNMGTSLQPLEGTYELITDVTETNPVETIFLGVSPDVMKREDVSTVWKALVYDRLNSRGNKLSYLLHGCSLDEWTYMTLYSTRVEDYFDLDFLKENVTYKISPEYGEGISPKATYKEKGMFAMKQEYGGEQLTSFKKGKSKFEKSDIDEESENYLRKIMEYCNENNIELVLVYLPITGKGIKALGDISAIHEYYQELALEYQIIFLDFNYYKDVVTVFTNEKFMDKKHLNGQGAEVFCEKLTEVYRAYHTGEDMGSYFLEQCPYYIETGETKNE